MKLAVIFILLLTCSLTVEASGLSEAKYEIKGFRRQAQLAERHYSILVHGQDSLKEVLFDELTNVSINLSIKNFDIRLLAKTASYKNGILNLLTNSIVEIKDASSGKRTVALNGMPPEKSIQLYLENDTIEAASSNLILEKSVMRRRGIVIDLKNRNITWRNLSEKISF